MAPDVVLQRRDVEVAHQHRALLAWRVVREPLRELVDEGELMREFVVDLGVRLVAARGYIEVVDRQGFAAKIDVGADMAGIAFAAKTAPRFTRSNHGARQWRRRDSPSAR